MIIKKVASRFLLPLEMYLGITAVSWAMAGGFGHGPVRQLLAGGGHAYLDDVWLVTLSAVGIAQIAAASLEWVQGREWELTGIWRSARIRLSIAFVSMLIWLWVLKMLTDLGSFDITLGLALISPATVMMQGWAAWENYRVRLAADNSIPTSTMIFKR